MRVLEALKILEDAVLDCRERPIDTPQTRQALDLFEPYISPKYVVRKFRDGLFVPNRRDYYLEGQQHNLDHWFRAIHRSIRALLAGRVLELCDRSAKTGDQRMKAELERLSAELERLPLKWEFIPRSSRH